MKKERRQYYRQLQSSFSEGQYASWNSRLAPHLELAAKAIPQGSLVAAYQAKPKEANLACLFQLPFQFCFPKVLSKKGLMEFRQVEDFGSFEVGAFGLLEPKPLSRRVEKREIHTCFVPLLSFDGQGKRLGQGMGFYDRFLEGFSGRKIGVGFEWQFSPSALPVEEFDQLLDAVITEHGIRTFTAPGAQSVRR